MLLTFTLFNKLVRRVAQEDFGMCFISAPTFCGCEKAAGVAVVVDRHDATTAVFPTEAAVAVVDVDGVGCSCC